MNIDDIDFNELYVQQKQHTTFKSKSKEDWNKKASSMAAKVFDSIYNQKFIDLMRISKGNSILDVGCGAGNLSCEFAKNFEHVYAIDYSSKMLEILNKKCNEYSNIIAKEISWDDDWHGIPQCDVVVASRSMEVADMRKALEKLNQYSKKAVYLTYKVGGSFLPKEILQELNLDIVKKPDYIYIINILYQMGINPEVSYIKSENSNFKFSDFNDLVKKTQWSLGAELCDENIYRLKELYKKMQNDEISINPYQLWAFISWYKQ